MSRCAFYACKNDGTEEATFVTESSGKQLTITSMVCDNHDRHTRGGGDLAVLFRRVDQPLASGYPALSGASDGPPNPPSTGGE